MQLEIDYGAREINDEEYERDRWRDTDLEPKAGGWEFVTRMAGTGYVHRHAG